MKIASSPCSFGVYHGQSPLPDPDRYVEDSIRAGYDGVDLGPDGFLGSPEELHDRLAASSAGLAGAYITLGELGERGSGAERNRIERTLELFEAAVAASPQSPRPVLTMAGAAATSEHLAGWRSGRYGNALSATDIRELTARVADIAEEVRAAGYETVVHPHLATVFETLVDAEPLLRDGGVALCVDTGHLWLAGEDPLPVLRSTARVGLVHLKDADRGAWHEALRDRAPGTHPWRERGFCALGAGELPLAEIVASLTRRRYTGWIVIEQDKPIGGTGPWSAMVAEQAANAAFLRALLT